MMYSMTGFGKHRLTLKNASYEISIKSLNSKLFDVNFKIPLSLKDLEISMREMIKKELIRGKIDVYINQENVNNAAASAINEKVLKSYVSRLKQVEKSLKLEKGWYNSMLLDLPDVIEASEHQLNKSEERALLKAMNQALSKVKKFRADEGKNIKIDFLKHIKAIEKKRIEVEKLFSKNGKEVKKRLTDKIKGSGIQDIDKNRLEQELIYYLEKFDLSEEVMRLKSHIDYFQSNLNGRQTEKGKKLGFITQEMGREINTIGSKANNAAIQRKVVEMKDDLEKIKEQIYNIL